MREGINSRPWKEERKESVTIWASSKINKNDVAVPKKQVSAATKCRMEVNVGLQSLKEGAIESNTFNMPPAELVRPKTAPLASFNTEMLMNVRFIVCLYFIYMVCQISIHNRKWITTSHVLQIFCGSMYMYTCINMFFRYIYIIYIIYIYI